MEAQPEIKTLPKNWYRTYETPQGPAVGMSEDFAKLGNGEVGKHWNRWVNHYRILQMGTAFTPEDQAMCREVIKEAEAFISGTTGFTPQEIWAGAVAIHELGKEAKNSPAHSNGRKP